MLRGRFFFSDRLSTTQQGFANALTINFKSAMDSLNRGFNDLFRLWLVTSRETPMDRLIISIGVSTCCWLLFTFCASIALGIVSSSSHFRRLHCAYDCVLYIPRHISSSALHGGMVIGQGVSEGIGSACHVLSSRLGDCMGGFCRLCHCIDCIIGGWTWCSSPLTIILPSVMYSQLGMSAEISWIVVLMWWVCNCGWLHHIGNTQALLRLKYEPCIMCEVELGMIDWGRHRPQDIVLGSNGSCKGTVCNLGQGYA